MNESPKQPTLKPASQQEFLTVFLANEREIFRYVAALVPTTGDVQEIVQQTAVALWEKFDDYDRSRPFAPWACRFALNVSRQWMARRQRWKALLEGGLAEELALRREQLRSEFDERLLHLDQCLQKLPEDQRSLVDGYYFRQLDVDTVAQEAHRTTDAVYKALQRFSASALQRFSASARQRVSASGGSCVSVSNVLSAKRRPYEVSFARLRQCGCGALSWHGQ